MPAFKPENIRNVAILGHQGSGKTTLMEGLLYEGKAIPEKGTVERKTTVSDYLPEEQKRQMSLQCAVASLTYKGTKVNLLDMPGNDDFIGEIIGVTRIIKGAVLVIDASVGVQVGTVKHWKTLHRRGIPTIIYLNKMDKEGVDFDAVLDEVRAKLGKNAVPFAYPLGHGDKFDGLINVVELKARIFNGKECVDGEIHPDKKAKVLELHNTIVEEVAKTDDALLEKFFGGEEFTPDEIHTSLRKGVLSGELIPVLVGAADKGIGLQTMLDMFIEYLPSPDSLKPIEAVDGNGNPVERETKLEEPMSAYVFKTLVDPYYGTINMIKVNSGVLKVGDDVYVNGNVQKVSALYSIQGKKLDTVQEIGAGDIGAVTRMEDIISTNTLCSPKSVIEYKPVKYPTAVAYKAITLTNKANEAKLGVAIKKLILEDPTLEMRRNDETKQLLLGGVSSSHVDFAVNKLKEIYKIDVIVDAPKIVYRESIKAKGEAEGSYKKQNGGSGFYGVVTMRFEPAKENEFAEEVFGGAVPKNFFPAVEKGFYEALQHGPLAGFPVLGVKGTLIDGKYHPVDSNEQAFRMAAILSFQNAVPKCKPIILEPILRIRVNVDQEYTGAVLGDLSTKRARVQGIDEKDGAQVIEALVPEAEVVDYASQLKALTRASGFYNREFYAYEEVPEFLKDKVIAENRIDNN